MKHVFVAMIAGLVAMGSACASDPGPPSVNTTERPGTMVQGRTIVDSGLEWGRVGHNDEWLVRSRTGANNVGPTATETVLTPRNGDQLADLGAPQVLWPTYYAMVPSGFTPPAVVTRPYLGTDLLLAGGATPAGPNQIFVDDGGTWSPGGTYAFDPDGEVAVAFSDSTLVTRIASSSVDAPLLVHSVAESAGVVTVGPAVSIALPSTWSGFSVLQGELVGSTLVVAGSGSGLVVAVATVELSDPSATAMNEVWRGTDISFRSFDVDVDESTGTVRAAVGVGATVGTGVAGRVVVLSPTGSGPWVPTAVLSAPYGLDDLTHGSFFGSKVALDDDLLVAVARMAKVPSGSTVGTSDVMILGAFRLTGGGWQYEASMTPAPDPIPTPETGRSVADLDVAGEVTSVEVMGGDEGFPPASFFGESWRV